MIAALIFALLLVLSAAPRAEAAIALVGTPTTTTQAFGSASISVTYPTGHASGQFAIVFIEATQGGTISATGWTAKAAGPIQNDGWGCYLLYRQLDGSEGASVSFSITAGDNILMAEMRLYSGVNASTPFDSAGANPQIAVGNTGQPNVTGFTTSQSNEELLFFAANQASTTTYGTPTGYGNASLITDSSHGYGMGGWDKAQAAAGATGAVTTSGGTAGNAWSALLTALQPAAVATGAYGQLLMMQ